MTANYDSQTSLNGSLFYPLPPEIMSVHIFGKLNIKDIPSVSLVCKIFFQYVQTSTTWKALAEYHWGLRIEPIGPLSTSWKLDCQRLFKRQNDYPESQVVPLYLFWRMGCINYCQILAEDKCTLFDSLSGPLKQSGKMNPYDAPMITIFEALHYKDYAQGVENYLAHRVELIKCYPLLGAWMSYLVNHFKTVFGDHIPLKREERIMIPKNMAGQWHCFSSLIEGAILVWIREQKEHLIIPSFRFYLRAIETFLAAKEKRYQESASNPHLRFLMEIGQRYDTVNFPLFFERMCEEPALTFSSPRLIHTLIDAILSFNDIDAKFKLHIDLLKKTHREDDALFVWAKGLEHCRLDAKLHDYFSIGWELIKKRRDIRSVLYKERFAPHPLLQLLTAYAHLLDGEISKGKRLLEQTRTKLRNHGIELKITSLTQLDTPPIFMKNKNSK